VGRGGAHRRGGRFDTLTGGFFKGPPPRASPRRLDPAAGLPGSP
jgi:hypothetical protein